MKKTLTSLFAILLVLTALLGLSSCGAVEFKVNFVVDGEVYATVNTSGKETIKIPDNPTKEDYTFDGWYWDKDAWEEPFTANSLLDAPISSDMNVYAKWKSEEPVHTHTSSDWIEDKAATCKEAGAKHKECTECKEVLESATIDKNDNHTPVTDARVEPTNTEDGLTEGSHCSVCQAVLTAQTVIPAKLQGTDILSNTMTVTESAMNVSVSNATDIFSFINDITVPKGASYIVARDIYCEQVIQSKTTTLQIGDNTFYILVTNGNDIKLYTTTIRRKPIYTVDFNTNGGTTVESQEVEEGYLAEEPTTSRIGYTLNSWSYNFNTPVTSDITVNASWNANPNTAYKVEYYLENVDKNGYNIISSETENLTGTTDTTAYAEQKTFDHFTLNYFMSQLGGNIDGDGSRVLRMYYTRNTYTLSNENTTYGSISKSGSYGYSMAIQVTATAKLGYEFTGWYSGNELLSTSVSYTFNIDRDVNARFAMKSEMANFNYTSTETTCTITGVKDASVIKIIIPECVTSIGENAFEGCSSLESIEIPSSVTSIGDNAFEGCSSLTSVTIGNGVKSIGYRAFYGCTNLEFYEYDNAYYLGNEENNYLALIDSKSTDITSCEINENTKIIGEKAFYYCTSLESIEIPNSVISIGDYAFFWCDSLYSVKFGDNSQLESIGDLAFAWCRSLTSIEIPSSVTSIGYEAFSNCKSLASVTIGNGVESIGEQAFYCCISLESIEIPSSVESIGEQAFYYCTSLKSITIPNSVTSIGYEAFCDCNSLASVTIGNGVTSIGDYAFLGCKNLANIRYRGNEEQWNAISKGAHWNIYYENHLGYTIDYTITYNYTKE